MAGGCQLEGGFDAYDDGIGPALAENVDGGGGGGIAGDDHRLDSAGHEGFNVAEGQFADLGGGAGAVGRIGGVTEIEVVFPRHLLDQGTQNADAAETGIEYRDVVIRTRHVMTLFPFYILYSIP